MMREKKVVIPINIVVYGNRQTRIEYKRKGECLKKYRMYVHFFEHITA